jgi:hypothetical protein
MNLYSYIIKWFETLISITLAAISHESNRDILVVVIRVNTIRPILSTSELTHTETRTRISTTTSLTHPFS